jgi:pimeloyl-ACP methyl ester carboxylesterase
VKACVALAGPYNFADCWDLLPDLTRAAFRVRSRAATEDEARRNAATLDLTGHAAKVAAPLLVVSGRKDRLIPWQHAARLAHEAPDSTPLILPDGNHGCMNVAAHHRPYTADWVAARLAR